MPVPSSINDLSTTAASNSPSGNEAPTTADDYIRAHASFIATLRDGKVDKAGTVTPTANQPMGGYKHTGAGTAVAAGEYVVWNQTGVKFPALGIGTVSSAWGGTGVYALDIGTLGALACFTNGPVLYSNSYFDGSVSRAKETGVGTALSLTDGALTFYTYASVSAGAVQTLVQRGKIDTSGFWGVGTNITALNASELTSGTIPDARFSTGGTFTPTVTGIGSPGYTEQTGKYIRIGNTVHFTIALSWTGGTNGASVNIGGLPVASSANVHMFSVMANVANLSFSWTGTLVAYANGSTAINLGVIAGGSSMSSLLNPNAGTKEIYVSGSYLV